MFGKGMKAGNTFPSSFLCR